MVRSQDSPKSLRYAADNEIRPSSPAFIAIKDRRVPALLRRHSLAANILVGVCGAFLLLWAAVLVAIDVFPAPTGPAPHDLPYVRLKLVAALAGASAVALVAVIALLRRLLRPLYHLRDAMVEVTHGNLNPGVGPAMPSWELQELRDTFDRLVTELRAAKVRHEQADATLAHRARSVGRLLEFSQTVQGAGQAEQIYSALAHYLREELELSGVAVFTHDPAAVPNIQPRAALPESLLLPSPPLAEMDAGLCPCLRQNLSKNFRPEGSPIRCAIDQSLTLPATHPAFCVPFHVGQKIRGVVHMLLPPCQEWTDDRRTLAGTYVNAATSSLISLHLVADAEKQSLTDPLTGLYNRHSMDNLLQREVALSERHGHLLSLVMVDLDYFKAINDTHGHAAGDHLLAAFATCVRMTLRKTDLAFRYGGDEFVIALPQTPLAQAQQVVQKLRQAFATVDFSHAIARLDKQPTLSIGVAERSKANNILTLPALLAAADEALYAAKNANRNCVRVYEPPTKAA